MKFHDVFTMVSLIKICIIQGKDYKRKLIINNVLQDTEYKRNQIINNVFSTSTEVHWENKEINWRKKISDL